MHLNELDFNQLDDALTSARFNEHTPKQIDDALAVLRGLRGSVITDQDMDLAREEWGTTDDIQIEQNGTVSHEALAAIERLEAENVRLREALEPQWFYAGEDQSSDQCRFSIDEVLEDELCGWGPPKTGKHVLHVSTALPGPDIWVTVHVFTDEEKDERGDDETWAFEEFSTEAEARAALQETSHDRD